MSLLILVSMWIRGSISVSYRAAAVPRGAGAKVESGMHWLRAINESMDYLSVDAEV